MTLLNKFFPSAKDEEGKPAPLTIREAIGWKMLKDNGIQFRKNSIKRNSKNKAT